jgi:hypothetical protein
LFEASPGKKLVRPYKPGMVVQACNPNYTRETKVRGPRSEAGPSDPTSKITKVKKSWKHS